MVVSIENYLSSIVDPIELKLRKLYQKSIIKMVLQKG